MNTNHRNSHVVLLPKHHAATKNIKARDFLLVALQKIHIEIAARKNGNPRDFLRVVLQKVHAGIAAIKNADPRDLVEKLLEEIALNTNTMNTKARDPPLVVGKSDEAIAGTTAMLRNTIENRKLPSRENRGA
jgi:hypothetical protein